MMHDIIGSQWVHLELYLAKLIANRISKVEKVNLNFQFQNNDGIPDRPLRYEFDSADPTVQSIIQFPLGFCPGSTDGLSPSIKPVNCTGQWGFVFKEWQTITAVSLKQQFV
jgi:hypothetical protein